MLVLLIGPVLALHAQKIGRVQLLDRTYEYGVGRDSITLFFNVYDENGKRLDDLSVGQLNNINFYEKGRDYSIDGTEFFHARGTRIPSGFTFSVLVDRSIPEEGLDKIYSAVGELVESAPDSTVFLSFFGDEVTSSELVTDKNLADWRDSFFEQAQNKFFYSALYAKLAEFTLEASTLDNEVKMEDDYRRNPMIASRASEQNDKTVLFIFTEGMNRPSFEEIKFLDIIDYQLAYGKSLPKVYAFYYTENGSDPLIAQTLEGVCSGTNIPEEKRGAFRPADDMEKCLKDFEEIVSEQSYDYGFRYKAYDNYYRGQVDYLVKWKEEWKDEKTKEPYGEASFTIGSPEKPWPLRTDSVFVKILVALLTALIVIVIFFLFMKVIIPMVKSTIFAAKYYKTYVPEPNVQRRICHYCKKEIEAGQRVVMKCSHIMHVHCWKQNGYKCAEYGQNCNTGIQSHVNWRELFSKSTLRDGYQMISGVCAAFISWLVFELVGRGGFGFLAEGIVNLCLRDEATRHLLYGDCVRQASVFLLIGLLLGFFLSLVFRLNDEYRSMDYKVFLKHLGFSLLGSLIGMAAFAFGAMISCWILSWTSATFIPWYCSLPAYILFSLSIALALTIRSTIPMKSALIGGGAAAVIGFLVLFFSPAAAQRWEWMSLLLDFIIFGGGLGASLVTVRMLAEKYFLVIQNGVRADQRIPIHKWMNATGGGQKVSIGMTGECEIQMNWEKSNAVAKEHARLFIDPEKLLPMIKPLATGVVYNSRVDLAVGKPYVLSNGDTFKIGNTIFKYVESE